MPASRVLGRSRELTGVASRRVQTTGPIGTASGLCVALQVKKGYVGIHSSGFKDFLLKPELLRAIQDCGFEHPSEGERRGQQRGPATARAGGVSAWAGAAASGRERRHLAVTYPSTAPVSPKPASNWVLTI